MTKCVIIIFKDLIILHGNDMFAMIIFYFILE